MNTEKITSLDQLEQLSQSLVKRSQAYKYRVLICMTGCRALGAQNVASQFRDSLAGTDLESQVDVVETGCIDRKTCRRS